MYPLLTWEIYQSNTSANTSVKYVSQIRQSNTSVKCTHVLHEEFISQMRQQIRQSNTSVKYVSQIRQSNTSYMRSKLVTWRLRSKLLRHVANWLLRRESNVLISDVRSLSVKYVSQIRQSNTWVKYVRQMYSLLIWEVQLSNTWVKCTLTSHLRNLSFKCVSQIRESNTLVKYVSQIRESNVLTSHLRSSSVKYVSQMYSLLTWEIYHSNTSVK